VQKCLVTHAGNVTEEIDRQAADDPHQQQIRPGRAADARGGGPVREFEILLAVVRAASPPELLTS